MADVNYVLGSSAFREAYAIRLSTTERAIVSTFELPARNEALPNYAATPAAGQNSILFSPSVARVALPGRVVTDTDPRRYILHENHIPAKIMAAGDINVPLGQSRTIDTPLPLTPLTYMDFHARLRDGTGAAADFWNPPYFDNTYSSDQVKFTYTVNAQSITITNTGTAAITVRYVIFADSEQAPTTGGSRVLWKGNDGTRDFVQIKRPGSHDTNYNLSDIMVDSRLAYLPLVAEGFLSWPDDFGMATDNAVYGEARARVSFSNPSGFLPFVKQMVVFPSTGVQTAMVGGVHDVFVNSGATWSNRTTCLSSAARLKATYVDFYMSGNNPRGINRTTGEPIYNGQQALGLRYYIFAIPPSL